MRALVLATTALAVLAIALPSRAQTTDPVVAVVNGKQIKKSDVEAVYATLPEQYRQMPLEQIFDPLVEQVVTSQLLLAKAEQEKVADNPEVEAQLERARENVLRDAVVKAAIDKGVTEEKLKAAYEAMKSQPGFAFE